mmetsp:Transcript_29861/g.68511  ORF Transcript_29861/g.68511 Transcript_29861/m.68511 type:complete len:262 (-) Transcript_29861:317-1102(-)
MHVHTCLGSLNDPLSSYWGSFAPCISGWLLKSTTEFYNHPGLNLPIWFGVNCFSYSFGGIMIFFVLPDKFWQRTRFPYRTFAYLLIFVQGPLSFMADYVHMTNDSIFHVVDRFLASVMAILECIKIISLFHYVRPITFIACSVSFACTIGCFMNSQISQSNHDATGFIFWHNAWHMYPVVSTVIFSTEKWVLAGNVPAKSSFIRADIKHSSFTSNNMTASHLIRSMIRIAKESCTRNSCYNNSMQKSTPRTIGAVEGPNFE